MLVRQDISSPSCQHDSTAVLNNWRSASYAHNRPVTRIGARLKNVRKALRLGATDMARAALGKDASPKKVRDYANYVSRLERQKRTNISLDKLEGLARGCGLSLTAFVYSLESQTESDLKIGRPSGTTLASSILAAINDRALPAPIGTINDGLVEQSLAHALIRIATQFLHPPAPPAGTTERPRETRNPAPPAGRPQPDGV